MMPTQTDHHPLHSCIALIEEFRANMNMLEQAMSEDRRELLELERTLPSPGHPGHEAHKARIEALARRFADRESVYWRAAAEVERLSAECREKRAQAPEQRNDGALDTSLRNAIDDPRYWRDGDPALASFVSQGFKRLYPDDTEV